ncbi:Fe(2+) transporter permease subunit FeoB [Gilliamella sp. CG22]|uniref:Fe(2+) transporter permease subunit FeoB n=1 Tax=Gilliamella sp. CG22 TaxID=3351504 RepID=UPI003985B4A7
MKIALVGNPNCGKTTLFNLLTGSKQRVGNWPGVTVEQKLGLFSYHHHQYEVVDLPGTYSIESDAVSMSQDEWITREFVLTEKNNVIINVIDASNLQRSLYLTFQLIDLQVPMIVVLNMIDTVKNMGEKIDHQRLSILLGCPVVPISSTKKLGINLFYQAIENRALNKQKAQPSIDTLGQSQQKLLTRYISELPEESRVHQLNRWQLIEALLGHNTDQFNSLELEKLEICRQLLSAGCDNEIDVALASAIYETIDQVCKKVIAKPRELSPDISEKFDKITLGRFTGIPFFLIVMYAMFMVAINFGSVFIDFFEKFFGAIFVNGTANLLQFIHAPDWVRVILSDGIGNGIQTVSTFIPVIAAMFFALSFLEDSGYLARAAMVVDRVLRFIGLPGKAFVPMLMGFGCGVPAIMGTRTLESSRDRIMAICMIPFMSCGARLPVYALFAVIFFPLHASFVVFMLYLLGIGVAVLTGMILKNTLLKGELTPFIMEMPVYRIPTLRSILRLTWQRLKSFIFKAGKAIVIMVTILSLLNSWGTDNTFGHENTNQSVLSVISQKITPVFQPMGIDNKNWPATVGIFTGIFAKESIIATLNSLYSMDSQPEDDEQSDWFEDIKSAFATIPDNLFALSETITDPLGLSSLNDDIDTLQTDLAINSTAISKIKTSFTSSSAVIAYLIFILLYTPCTAVLGTIYREAGWRWMIFVAVWTFTIAWLVATIYYQFTQLAYSNTASYWLFACGLLITLMMFILRKVGNDSFKKNNIFNHKK